MPYVGKLAERGLDALREDAALAGGAATIDGKLTSKPVAEAQGRDYTSLEQALAIA
jgi:alanine dehydrogenase